MYKNVRDPFDGVLPLARVDSKGCHGRICTGSLQKEVELTYSGNQLLLRFDASVGHLHHEHQSEGAGGNGTGVDAGKGQCKDYPDWKDTYQWNCAMYALTEPCGVQIHGIRPGLRLNPTRAKMAILHWMHAASAAGATPGTKRRRLQNQNLSMNRGGTTTTQIGTTTTTTTMSTTTGRQMPQSKRQSRRKKVHGPLFERTRVLAVRRVLWPWQVRPGQE